MISVLSPRSQVRLSTVDTYFRDVGTTAVLTAEDENALCQRVRDGDSEARDFLIRSNLRLVVCIARGYRRGGVELDDMIAEGNLGLIRAAEGFDPDMGTRFSTYAAYWIKQSIKRMIINTAKPIRLPAYMNELMSKWQRATAELQDELKRTATFEEIAARLRLCPKKMKIIRKAIRIYNSEPATGQSDDILGIEHSLADQDRLDPVNALAQQEDIGKILRLLDTLDARDATILRLRFGLGDAEPMTLSDIGARLNLTRERVRQIERDALRQLAEKMDD